MSEKNSTDNPGKEPKRQRFGPALWPDVSKEKKVPDPERQRYGLVLDPEQENNSGEENSESRA